MDWFKHSTGSHNDADFSDAWDEFGDAAPTVFWTVLEIYGLEFSKLKDGWMTISLRYFERETRRKFTKTEKILEFFQNRSRIYFQKTDETVSIKIPKFIAIASNWTKRKAPEPTELPTEAPTEAPTAIEEKRREENKNKKRDIGDKSPIPPPISEVIQYCKERKNGIDPQKWFDHYAARGWMIGKNKMKDWKAAVRTWEQNEFGNGKQVNPRTDADEILDRCLRGEA